MRLMSPLLVCVLVLGLALCGCHGPMKNNLPPASVMMHPGPGVDGPGPGVMMYQPATPMPSQKSQMAFVGPEGMVVQWDVGSPGAFDSEPLVCPGRYNFPQGAIYRLKLTNIPGRPGVELYPTLEVGPAVPRTEAFLAHNAIPVQFTQEDLDQVLTGNFVTKVIYLPDPEYQELALAGVETLVSTRLDPGVDPIVEADQRGAILGVLRVGNKDFQIPGDMMEDGSEVTPISYITQDGIPVGPMGGPMGGPMPMGPPLGGATTMPMASSPISGVTAPQYGMPYCGTPLGLPGPPHVPLGGPAGLQRHVMRNHTPVRMPQPTQQFSIDVRQSPGFSYPAPVNHVRIHEKTSGGPGIFHQPLKNRVQVIVPEETGTCIIDPMACPTDGCGEGM